MVTHGVLTPPRILNVVCGQLYDATALTPEKSERHPLNRALVGPRRWSEKAIILRLKASAAVVLLCKGFCVSTRRRYLVRDQCFGTAYVSYHQGLNVIRMMVTIPEQLTTPGKNPETLIQQEINSLLLPKIEPRFLRSSVTQSSHNTE